jgi:hypothetical protein
MAAATASLACSAGNTPLIARRCAFRPSAASSWALRPASARALRSARATSTTVVSAGSVSVASAALKRDSCIFRPECGPRQEAPRSLSCRKPLQAWGRLSRRRVWPVGAVSNTTWSKSCAPPASRPENSSKEAISVVQAPESCSRTVSRSSAEAWSIWASTRWRYWSAATCGSMFSTDRPGTAGTGTGALRSGTPSISSRLEAASVLTSSTRRPWSASWMAVAVDSEVLPTPPCR